jgi:glycine/D-amino acid oxidase-like deaminating enzyme
MSNPAADVVVVGAGIVGAACAFSFAREGLKTLVLDASFPGSGATAAGMGHIVVMDDSEAQRALTLRSRELWTQLIDDMPVDCEYDRRGTLWMAVDDEEMRIVRAKADAYAALDMPTETLDAERLREAEPQLHPGLAGGLRVPDDFVIYPPSTTRWLIDRAIDCGAELRTDSRVLAIGEHDQISLDAHETIAAKSIVLANGTGLRRFFPDAPVRRRKGHLLITERRPGFLHHQVIELGYLKSTHGVQKDSVACNVQPRPTGQLLVGSSRQTEDDELPVRPQLVSRMLARAARYIPELPKVRAIRTWTGFRAATPDKLPIIGPMPDRICCWRRDTKDWASPPQWRRRNCSPTTCSAENRRSRRGPTCPNGSQRNYRVPDSITVLIDGRPHEVPDGVTVVAALALAQQSRTRTSRTGEPRGPLCGMGICAECRVVIDGVANQLGCQVFCRSGMEISTDGE